MKAGLWLSAIGLACVVGGGPGGPCPAGVFVLGILVAPAGWLVSLASLMFALNRSVSEVVGPAIVAVLLTAAIILVGNAIGEWRISEPESWTSLAVFLVLPLTSAGILVQRRLRPRKA